MYNPAYSGFALQQSFSFSRFIVKKLRFAKIDSGPALNARNSAIEFCGPIFPKRVGNTCRTKEWCLRTTDRRAV